MGTLAEAVQALPPELFDEVFNYTFTAPSGLVINIDQNYKPPALLQVSRGTREQYAKSYYGGSTIFSGSWADTWDWNDILTLDHVSFIKEIRVADPQCLAAGMSCDELSRWLCMKYGRNPWPFFYAGMERVRFKVVFVEARDDQPEEYRWMSYTDRWSKRLSMKYHPALFWHKMKKAGM